MRPRRTEARDVDRLLLAAAGLETEEREALLARASVDAPTAVAQVRLDLEQFDTDEDSLLERPAAERLGGGAFEASTAVETELSEEDRYELGPLLGAGGMGVVRAARDRQLGRDVALKFLRKEDAETRRLFLGEARAQARVRHGHVLEIYDSGTLDGRAFLSMRRVHGGTLGELASDLPLEQRVRLLAQAAWGLHEAHRAGLLHRDIKPSNILVDRAADGGLTALITDFGLAADVDDSEEPGAIAGTPSFIAPERLLVSPEAGSPAAADRRSDVYSLGATAFEVLTGRTPIDGANTLEVLNRAARGEVAAPRAVAPELPKELEAVVRRAMALDPGHRYGSARALAEDFERYLDGDTVEAYAAGVAYRLTRFALRHRVLVATALAAFVTVIVASAAVAVFAVSADRARDRAELRQGQAEELIRFMVVDLQEKLDGLGRLDLLQDVGDAAQGYFASVPAEELSTQELMRRARMLYQIGDVHLRRGELGDAVEPMMESLALNRRLVELQPLDDDALFELGQSHFWVGYLHWQLGDLGAAGPPFEAYLDVSRRLVARDPESLEYRQELAYAHSNLGSLSEARGNFSVASDHFLAALRIEQVIVAGAAEPDPAALSELAASHNTVARVLQSLGELDEAERFLRGDLEIRQGLPQDLPRRRYLLSSSYGHLAQHLLMRGEAATARTHFFDMRKIAEELTALDPSNTAWAYQLAWSEIGLALSAAVLGESESVSAALDAAHLLIDGYFDVEAAPRWRRAG
ncbi:MAG: serine/threonine-protein kinase, partial [Acidobacteriota bacterium]